MSPMALPHGLPPLPQSLVYKKAPPVPPPKPRQIRSSSFKTTSALAPVEPIKNNYSSLRRHNAQGYYNGNPSDQVVPAAATGASDHHDFSTLQRPQPRPRPSLNVLEPACQLDAQLMQLKRDMKQLRQMDMTLLGHLLSIHQRIQDLRETLMPPAPRVRQSSKSLHGSVRSRRAPPTEIPITIGMTNPVFIDRSHSRSSATSSSRGHLDDSEDGTFA